MDGSLLPRHLKAELNDALQSARVVNIVGPRQSGKTTLVRDLLHVGKFITFDDENVLAGAPTGVLELQCEVVGRAETMNAGPNDCVFDA